MEPPAAPTFIVVHRDADGRVGFLQVDAPTARLLELMDSDEDLAGAALLARVAAELGGGTTQELLEQGRRMLRDPARARHRHGHHPRDEEEPMIRGFTDFTLRTHAALDRIGSWLPQLALRAIVGWEFFEAGLAKFRGENWFGSIREGFQFPFDIVPAEISWFLATWTELGRSLKI